MGNVINTNVKALMASNALNKNGRVQQNVMESLSTGKSINRASDNAAGLSIRETMTAQINGLNAAVKNANDSISMLQTADGALNETSSMLQRMRELAVLSVNDTYSTTQKTAMSTEFNQLSSEIDRISTQTQWNGMAILNGSGGLYSGNTSTGQFTFQVGANTTQTISVIIGNVAITSGAAPVITGTLGGLSGASVANAAGATLAIAALDVALTTLNTQRSTIGAMVNRLTHAVDNLTNVAQNASDSRSKVEDTDYAAATSELARTQIIAQAATAILAQANQQPQSVLSLLK
jgi:flagellin